MFKKLDSLILRAFIGPFLATFLLAIFVLILQFFWLWIDDFVGKGVDFPTLAKLVGFVALSWVPVALPLSILISTIMTFGNLGESYELVAIKSAGISLQRFMRPVLMVSIVVCIVSFFFNNNILPYINLKLNKMKYELVNTKPAFDIKPGVMYDKIPNFVLRVSSKDNNTNTIKDVLIYEQGNYLQDNLIVADSGKMTVSDNKRFLEFTLYNGSRYEENGQRNSTSTDYTVLHFDEYKKNFDLSGFFKVETSDSAFKDSHGMLNKDQLQFFIDSLNRQLTVTKQNIAKQNTYSFFFSKNLDSNIYKPLKTLKKPASIKDIIPDSTMQTTMDYASGRISSAKSGFDFPFIEVKNKERDLRAYKLAYQQKFSLSFACFVLFLIGAPLGSIIRKGGIGTPLVFAVIFFVIFHLLNTTGMKMTKEGVLNAFWGPWLPCIALLPVGIFLVSKAMKDSQLFNKEYYLRILKSIRTIFAKKKI